MAKSWLRPAPWQRGSGTRPGETFVVFQSSLEVEAIREQCEEGLEREYCKDFPERRPSHSSERYLHPGSILAYHFALHGEDPDEKPEFNQQSRPWMVVEPVGLPPAE